MSMPIKLSSYNLREAELLLFTLRGLGSLRFHLHRNYGADTAKPGPNSGKAQICLIIDNGSPVEAM